MTRPPWFDDAAAAFHAAGRNDVRTASDLVGLLAQLHGPEVLPAVMLSWIDTMAHAAGVTEYGRPRRLGFLEVTTGTYADDADGVSSDVAWAGRLINARIADDEETFRALLNAALVDDTVWGRRVLVLLGCCAATAAAHGRR